MRKYFYLLILLAAFINSAYADIDSDKNSNAMLFVSLGMPKLALRQYVIQSKLYHIPLVLRGLLENSYPKTAKTIFDILHPKNSNVIKGGFEIDPLYFRKYHITTVPALVINNQNNYTVVYGNIPIQNLLQTIATKSQDADLKNQARQYLENKHA